MTAATGMLSLDLGPTATYRERRATWVPRDPALSADGRVGTLTVVQQKGRRGGPNDPVHSYGIQEDFQDVPTGCRAFLLLNDTPPSDDDDPERSEIYRIVVGPHGSGCTCKATACGSGKCKHRAALLALLEEGAL